MGHQVCQLLATLCVASSLALVALGGSNLVGWVLPPKPEPWQTSRQSWGPFQIRLPYSVMHRAHHVRSRMMSKIIFTTPAEPNCFASSVVTPQGYKADSCSCAMYIFSHDVPPSLCLLPYGLKERENRERDMKK
jgi:hypothetical protein